MTDALHPDHLRPGDMVGPWRIVRVLGRGGSSRVFKVERDGRPYTLKVALRPLSESKEDLAEEQYVEELSAYRQLAREAAALFTYSSHPNLLRVYAVDFWPNPHRGYAFLVTDYVDGDNWHEWRWRKPAHATRLVDTFSYVVRTVGVLHARGVYHRDLKAENVLIRREDGRPFLIDFGTVRLPGTLTQTLGVPDGAMHLLPPELLAYVRAGAVKRGEPFQGGVAADLYALGVLLYQALTDLHPFDPELPDKELVAAIATVPPAAPQILNPRVPRSLSDIALKLLEKKPEERYPDTQALLQALERAAENERQSPAWKVPLFTSAEAPPSQDEGSRVEARRQLPASAGRPRRTRWPLVLLAGLTMLGLALWLAHSTLTSPPEALSSGSGHSEKGSPPVSTPSRATSSSLLVAWLCAGVGLGCPAAQVKPPGPEDCPREAVKAMFQELKIDTGYALRVIVDINQPGDIEAGFYQDGPVIGRLTEGNGNLLEGTLLHGRLWTGPDIYELDEDGKPRLNRPAVMGRYTLAVLPDGRKYPVCIVTGGRDDGRVPKHERSKPGAAVLNRELPMSPVKRWL